MAVENTSSGQPQIQVPVVASTELALTAVNALRAEMSIRHDALQQRMDMMEIKSREQHQDLVRVPTEVQKAVSAVREFLEQFIGRTAAELSNVKGRQIESVHGEINTAIASLHGEISTSISIVNGKIDTAEWKSEERFKSVQTQFTLLKQATEQLDLANKTAIAAALQAQKESAGETQKSSQAAIAKSETSTSEAIRTLTATVQQQFTASDVRINDVKSRLDKSEGKSGVFDPGMADAVRQLGLVVSGLKDAKSAGEGRSKGASDFMGYVVGVGGLLLAALAFFLKQ